MLSFGDLEGDTLNLELTTGPRAQLYTYILVQYKVPSVCSLPLSGCGDVSPPLTLTNAYRILIIMHEGDAMSSYLRQEGTAREVSSCIAVYALHLWPSFRLLCCYSSRSRLRITCQLTGRSLCSRDSLPPKTKQKTFVHGITNMTRHTECSLCILSEMAPNPDLLATAFTAATSACRSLDHGCLRPNHLPVMCPVNGSSLNIFATTNKEIVPPTAVRWVSPRYTVV